MPNLEDKTVAFMVHATIKNKKYLVDSGAINESDVAQSLTDIIIKEIQKDNEEVMDIG